MNKIIKLIIAMLMMASFSSVVSATDTIVSKEFVTGTYGKAPCDIGIGDCIYKVTTTTGWYYKLDRQSTPLGSIVYSKSPQSVTINQGQTASITYTIKGSGADGFNSHFQKYEWYDSNSRLINVYMVNAQLNTEYSTSQPLSGFNSPGTFEYTVLEWIQINLENQCWYLHENPCADRYRQVWAKADEYYPKVVVNGGIVPTPTYTVNPTPTVTYTPQPTYSPQPTPTGTVTPPKPKIIPKPIADLLGIKETPGFEASFAIIGIVVVLYLRRKYE